VSKYLSEKLGKKAKQFSNKYIAGEYYELELLRNSLYELFYTMTIY